MARLRGAPENSPEAMEAVTGVPAADIRAAARLYATAGNAPSITAWA
jgi:formate dehydrogenase major subunit